MPSNNNTNEIEFHIKPGPVNSRLRRLVINPDFIQFDENALLNTVTRFEKGEICEYRSGVKWISGFKFTIGREYLIFIRSSSGQVMKIAFKSFYGIKKQKNYKQNNDILNAIWDAYFGRIAGKFYCQFCDRAEITIGRATLNKESVSIDEGGIIRQDKKVISWADLAIKEYRTYIAIYSLTDPSKINAAFSYLNDWNTAVLYTVVKKILNEKNYLAGSDL